mmetsp:Transcript_12301/g.22349  ORF Transcript_12301/g.22349 Transcript_12301/m.22349 type:complete len:235 (-) Transcript_12301:2441-3145(-)
MGKGTCGEQLVALKVVVSHPGVVLAHHLLAAFGRHVILELDRAYDVAQHVCVGVPVDAVDRGEGGADGSDALVHEIGVLNLQRHDADEGTVQICVVNGVGQDGQAHNLRVDTAVDVEGYFRGVEVHLQPTRYGEEVLGHEQQVGLYGEVGLRKGWTDRLHHAGDPDGLANFRPANDVDLGYRTAVGCLIVLAVVRLLVVLKNSRHALQKGARRLVLQSPNLHLVGIHDLAIVVQ